MSDETNALLTIGVVLPWGCGPAEEIETGQQPVAVGGDVDSSPGVTFSQVGKTVGIDRANEPPSAGTFTSTNTLAYGGWLADLDGDGRLDYFGVNHGQFHPRSHHHHQEEDQVRHARATKRDRLQLALACPEELLQLDIFTDGSDRNYRREEWSRRFASLIFLTKTWASDTPAVTPP